MIDEKHSAALRFLGDSILRLALGSDKQNCFSLSRKVGHELRCFFEQAKSLLKIDDIDSVAFTENILLHLRVPPLGLVSEVDARFQKLLHCNRRQINLRFEFKKRDSDREWGGDPDWR